MSTITARVAWIGKTTYRSATCDHFSTVKRPKVQPHLDTFHLQQLNSNPSHLPHYTPYLTPTLPIYATTPDFELPIHLYTNIRCYAMWEAKAWNSPVGAVLNSLLIKGYFYLTLMAKYYSLRSEITVCNFVLA
jgi:hypothetical protein